MLRSRLDRPKANRVFTNREEPIAHFERARAELPVDQHRVLGFHGVGGQGKTYLRNELIKRLSAEQPRSHRFGVIDFDTQAHCDAAQGLLQLRCSLHVSGAIRTQVFDVAILRYWEQVYPTQDPQTALGTVLGDNAELFANIADTVTGGLAGLALQVARKLLHNLKEQRAMDACQALDQLDHLDNTELLGMLPAYLGLDLQRHRADQPDQCAPILFFDTYEALWSDRPDKTGITAIETDAWVRELITAAPGCLFVILGRERLNWNRALPDHGWAELLDDQHLLGGLSEDDAEQFLRAIPIDDAAIRCVIIDGASVEDDPSPTPGSTGALPFYLDLAVDTWLDLEATGIQPTPDQFGHSHPMVIARFLRHRDPAEIEALKVLSVPNGFDRDLFTALMVHFHTGYQPSRFEELCGLTIIEPSTDGLWRPHALMREYLLDQLEPAFRRELDAVLFDWYDARCQPASPRDIEPAHETALKDAVAHRDTEDAVAALAWFWLRQQVFWDAARLTLLEPFYRWALALAEDRLGPDHPETAIGLNNLALLLQATNRLSDAEPLMRRVVSIFEVSYGEEHPKVATALNNLAQLLQATNRLSEAEPLMRRALAIDEASYGAEHPEVARDLNNLAALLQATNRLSEAEPLMRRALAIDEASYGAEHPEVARDLNNLAQLLQATNRLSEAEPLMRRALAIDEASYGAEHPEVARDLNNLAALLQATNRLSEAEPLMRRALAIDEASYGAEHPEVARDLNNLAQLLKATNRLSEAEPLMRRALAIDEASYGAEHPDVARDLNNLAALLQATNRLSEAEPLMRRALAIDEASYGAEHPEVARDLNNLAQLLKATNRLSEAEPLMRRALAIDEASYGAEHPDVARDLNNLAQLLQDTNRLSEAEPLMRRALAIDEASYGSEHPNVAIRLNNLAQLLKATNRLSEAEPLSRRHVLIFLAFTRDTGHRHPHLVAALSNYWGLLSAGEWTETEMQERLLSLGPEAGLEESIWVALLGELGDTD